MCIQGPPVFTQARAWACYFGGENREDPLRTVVQQFKYGKKVSLGRPLGRLLSSGCVDFFRGCSLDCIVPVPLHPKRLRWRGFNQAVILSREVSRSWNLPLDPFILSRPKETEPQTELTEEKRKKNVRGAFVVNPDKSIRGKTILLVDDIYTSGATANECSRVLLGAGAREIHVLTLARAVS